MRQNALSPSLTDSGADAAPSGFARKPIEAKVKGALTMDEGKGRRGSKQRGKAALGQQPRGRPDIVAAVLLPSGALCVIGRLAMRGEVETLALVFLARPEPDEGVHRLVEDVRTDAAPQDGDGDRRDLDDDLREDREILAARAAERRRGEDARADGADDSADAVHAEDVEAVVIAEAVLHDRDE